MSGGWQTQTSDTSVTSVPLPGGSWYWWSVTASDRAGDLVSSTPSSARFYLSGTTAAPAAGSPELPEALPNPGRGPVALRGMGAGVVIYDVAGRKVASQGHGVTWIGGAPVWDGDVGGLPAPPGVYLARGARGEGPVRIVRLR
jgi:hypothetical protein